MTTHANRCLLFVAAVVAVLACFGKFRPSPPATYSKTSNSGPLWPLAASAQSAETPPSPGFAPEAIAEGASLLDAAIARLKRHKMQVGARHTVEFDGQTMIGRGVYMHEPVAVPGAMEPTILSHVEFRTSLSANEPEPEFVQVFDGTTLWEYRDIRGSVRWQRLDLATLLNEVNQALAINKPLTLAAAPGLQYGGLLQLLHTLRSDLDFVRAPGDPSQPNFVRLIGKWNRVGLDRVAPRTRAPRKREPLLSDLPSDAPTHAELVLEALDGAGSLRVRRLRWIHVKQTSPSDEQTLATIEFDGDEHIDEALEARWFQFAPPKSVTVENITDSYRQKVGLIAPAPPPVRGK